MAPYWSSTGPAGPTGPGANGAPRGRRASSAGSSTTMAAGPLGRKTSSAGEAYHRIVGVPSSTRNPLYGLGLQGLQAMNAPGLADSVAGSASDDTSSASASRHYVDPWDLENFMYLKRHWAEEEQASSTPALETAAQSDFYYVGGTQVAAPSPGLDGDVDVDIVDVDVEAYPAPYRPDSVLLLADEPLSLGAVGLNMNSVEEESFFNERYDPARHHRLVKRSHSAAATYLQHRREEPRAVSVMASMASANARNAYAARRRSVACAPRYYRTPITGGDSSGEYEAFEDYADELSRRLGAVELAQLAQLAPAPPLPAPARTKRHSVAMGGRLPQSHQAPRSRASVAGPAPMMGRAPAASQSQAAAVRRRHSHCAAWPAPSPGPGPAPAHIYSTRRASFSRGQLLAGLHAVHAGRYASDLASYGPASAYGHGGGPYAPYGAAAAGAGGSSDDCYVSDASDEYGDTGATTTTATATPAPRRDAVVDGFTDADLMYAQLASSLYGDAYGYGYCGGSGSGGGSGGSGGSVAYGTAGMDCSRFQLTNYGHLKIDYSCSWRSLDHYIAHS